MLNRKHMAVIRAALQFFDEEMSPHGEAAFSGYLAPDDRDLGVGVQTISEARHILAGVSVHQVLYDRSSGRIADKNVIAIGERIVTPSNSGQIIWVPILIPVENTES